MCNKYQLCWCIYKTIDVVIMDTSKGASNSKKEETSKKASAT
jgi:hypothetical protein